MARTIRTRAEREKVRREKAGRRAETWCRLWLNLTGWHVLARRYRTPLGEIDLVARRGRQLAFIEVKARSSLPQGMEAVSRAQQARIARAAELWRQAHPAQAALETRFDLMVVVPWSPPRRIPQAWIG